MDLVLSSSSTTPFLNGEARIEHTTRAAQYWLQSGDRAMERSADREAESHLSNGLEAVLRLPTSAERDVREVELQGGLFRSRTTTDGRASANAASSLDRMRELSTRLGDPDTLLTVLIGDRIQHGSGAKYREALRVLAEIALSTSRQEPHVGAYKSGSVVGGRQRAAMRGDIEMTQSQFNELLSLPRNVRSPIDTAWGELVDGWVPAKHARVELGIETMRGCLGFWPMQASSCSTRYRLHGLLNCTWNMNNGRRHVSLLSRHKHMFGVTTNTSGCPKFTDWKVVFGGPKVSTIATRGWLALNRRQLQRESEA